MVAQALACESIAQMKFLKADGGRMKQVKWSPRPAQIVYHHLATVNDVRLRDRLKEDVMRANVLFGAGVSVWLALRGAAQAATYS
jgi:hypothetical protein